LAVVASRSALTGALLRTVTAVNTLLLTDFLDGLSRDELECLAEFEGACMLEAMARQSAPNRYRVMPEFFDSHTERWSNPSERAHKTFVVLAWMEYLQQTRPAVSVVKI
jgi:hypothetical protein